MTDNVVILHSGRFIDAEGVKKAVRKKFNGVVVTSENYQNLLKEGGRDLINYHNRHLKAYKRDENYFAFGRNQDGSIKWIPVAKQFYVELA